MNLNDKEILNVDFFDTVFDPAVYGFEAAPKKVGEKLKVYYEKGDSALYRVWLFLVGNDLPFIEYVNYNLDVTFPDPVRRVQRSVSNPNCLLDIWTWGIFTVVADIVDKSGRTYRLERRLGYGDLIERYKPEIDFIEDNSKSRQGAFLV